MKNKEQPLSLTDKNFHGFVLSNLQPVLVHFKTSWSGASHIISLIIEELARQLKGEIAFYEVDADQHTQIARKFDIACIPTVVIFKNGRVTDRLTGVVSKSELAERLSALLRQ